MCVHVASQLGRLRKNAQSTGKSYHGEKVCIPLVFESIFKHGKLEQKIIKKTLYYIIKIKNNEISFIKIFLISEANTNLY